MDLIKTSAGNFETDYLVSIPDPKMVFFRILGRPLADVERIFANVSTIQRLSTVFTGCSLAFVTNEEVAVKVAMTYDTKRFYE